MFKFIKELIDSAKEGVAEARQELAEEEAERLAKASGGAEASRIRMGQASMLEAYAVGLAAPYRETFAPALKYAEITQVRPAHLYCIEIPSNEVESWAGLLGRDFDISDSEDAAAMIEALAESMHSDPEAPAENAAWIARTCHLATAAAAVGHISKSEALVAIEPVAMQAAAAFTDWSDYGRRFLETERELPGSNIVGRRFLSGAVERLTDNAVSPWRNIPWPSSTTVWDQRMA